MADLLSNRPFCLGPGRPLALPEPEPTQPFDLSLSEPTYLHRPDLFGLPESHFLHIHYKKIMK